MSPKWNAFFAAAAAVLTPGLADAAGLDLRGERLDVAVRPTAQNADALVVGGIADVRAMLPDVETQLQLGVETGVQARDRALLPLDGSTARNWESSQMGLTAAWSPWSRAKFELAADARMRNELSHGDGVWALPVDRRVRTLERLARFEAMIEPFGPVDLRLGAATTENARWTDANSQTGPVVAELLHANDRQVFAAGEWRPFSRLSLEAAGRLQTVEVDWSGTGERSGAYSFATPRLSASLRPWEGAAWSLSAERRVAPINLDQYASFARSADGGAGSAFAPDQELLYQASIRETLSGNVVVNAGVTRAVIENVTDLGPVGTLQAPIGIGPGVRSQVEAGLSAPLTWFGAPGLKLTASGVWRTSQVDDPFTGDPRRLSGELPYEAEVTLTGAAGPRARWGLSAQAAGGATVYQMNQMSARSAVAGLSGFLRYEPGPVAIQLDLDNMLGGETVTRDVYFIGGRALRQIDRIDEREGVDRGVRLRLEKSL